MPYLPLRRREAVRQLPQAAERSADHTHDALSRIPDGYSGSAAEGTSVFVETIFENRYRHIPELIRLGASIKVEGRVAVVQGVERLSGAKLCAGELRGGAALVTAALAAEGTSEITGVGYIDRGYESIEKALRSVGADISRVGQQSRN